MFDTREISLAENVMSVFKICTHIYAEIFLKGGVEGGYALRFEAYVYSGGKKRVITY
jgi:hypothetical protein